MNALSPDLNPKSQTLIGHLDFGFVTQGVDESLCSHLVKAEASTYP